MGRFKEYLTERYVNALDTASRAALADEVWDILQDSYKAIGGLKGRCFGSKAEMIKEVPFWKVVRKDDKIIACVLYKDRSGRKVVALGTDGTAQGKSAVTKIIGDELKQKRSYVEVSGPAERMIIRNFKDLYDTYKVPFETAAKILGQKHIKPVQGDDYRYVRTLGKHEEEKIMLGTPNVAIY